MYINIAVQYIRPKQVFYIRETLQKIVLDILGSDDLDLEVDPTVVSVLRFYLEFPFQTHLDIPCSDVTGGDAVRCFKTQ